MDELPVVEQYYNTRRILVGGLGNSTFPRRFYRFFRHNIACCPLVFLGFYLHEAVRRTLQAEGKANVQNAANRGQTDDGQR